METPQPPQVLVSGQVTIEGQLHASPSSPQSLPPQPAPLPPWWQFWRWRPEAVLAGATRILVRSMSEDDVRTILADPLVMVGSDGPCVAPYGITGQGKPHPRLYGTFPRVLGHYARDLHLLGLPQAIHKMTGCAAAVLGLVDRGTIAAGSAADLVLFDPETIADRASFDDPHQYPEGIDMVIVNGVVVIDRGGTPAPARLPAKSTRCDPRVTNWTGQRLYEQSFSAGLYTFMPRVSVGRAVALVLARSPADR